MGVPAVYVAWSDGQIEDAAHFEQLGWARSAGRADDPTAPDRVVALVEEVLGDAGRWQAMSAAGRAAVDGRGPHRVVDAMEELLGGSAT
jgi:UDP-N-acetylglucosamine:LPS N-acetylglucosamine transferase